MNNENQKRNVPIIAKTNFMIAHKALLKGVIKDEPKKDFEKSKELDEWLMGSGESDLTAGSSTSNNPLKNNLAKKEV